MLKYYIQAVYALRTIAKNEGVSTICAAYEIRKAVKKAYLIARHNHDIPTLQVLDQIPRKFIFPSALEILAHFIQNAEIKLSYTRNVS